MSRKVDDFLTFSIYVLHALLATILFTVGLVLLMAYVHDASQGISGASIELLAGLALMAVFFGMVIFTIAEAVKHIENRIWEMLDEYFEDDDEYDDDEEDDDEGEQDAPQMA